MQSWTDGGDSPENLSEHASKLAHFLYDGLPPAAQDFFQRSNHQLHSTTDLKGSTFLSDVNIQQWIRSLSRTKILLSILWVFVLWWGEKRVFYRHVSACQWENWESWEQEAVPHRVVLLADPQLVDPHTYPGRPWPLSTFTVWHTDQYLRRSFISLDSTLDPQTVFFLGDLFDGGREWSTANSKSPDPRWHKFGQKFWLKEYNRFGKIYPETWRARSALTGRKDRRLIATLPGNHDLGLAGGVQLAVRERFETFFGNGNRVDVIGNHTFVSIDSVSLSAKAPLQKESQQAESDIWNPTEFFLDKVTEQIARVAAQRLRVEQGQPENALQRHSVYDIDEQAPTDQWHTGNASAQVQIPTIVLSHVPFFRDEGTPCGPLRERYPPSKSGLAYDPETRDDANAIRVAAGYQYQNVLTPDLSRDIVRKIGSIRHIFSGDDHDYCEIIHRNLIDDRSGIPEITVKSTSWAMGVRKPGFLLVSLWNPLNTPRESDKTVQTHLCLLPDQLSIFIRYGQMLLLTFLILVLRSCVSRRSYDHVQSSQGLLPLPVSTPTFPRVSRHRERADSVTYASSSNSSDGRNGLAVRSNAGRSRPLSPAYGYGFDHGFGSPADSAVASPSNNGFLSPMPDKMTSYAYSAQGVDSKSADAGNDGWHKIQPRGKTALYEFLYSILHVAATALLWYAWLAYTV